MVLLMIPYKMYNMTVKASCENSSIWWSF